MGNYKFKINGKQYEVAVDSIQDGNASVTVNGVAYNVEIEGGISAAPAARPAPAASKEAPAPEPAVKAAGAASGKTIASPLPGTIVEVCVKEGQTVTKGQKLFVLEAMKMENEVQAETDGTVTSILVNKGDSVLEGAALASIA